MFAGLEMKGIAWLPGAESDRRKMPAWKQGPQSYNHKELDSANHLKELGDEFSPSTAKWEFSPVHTLFLVLWCFEQSAQQRHVRYVTYNTKLINGCCVKPLHFY